MTTNFTRRVTIAGLAVAGLATSLTAVSAPSAALADTGSRPGTGILKSVDDGATRAAGTYSKTLTFTLTTTSPAPAGGNVEFEWKVEEGESSVIPVLLPITYDNGAVPTGDDINIGVGELQECTVSKSMDSTHVDLAQFAINGDPAEGRKYDYAWSVQSGRDAGVAAIKEVSGLTAEQDVIEGAKGGNVEFEWKVEEGES